MFADTVTYYSDNRIAIISLNRPKKMNKIDEHMVNSLEAAWVRFMASRDDRVGIIKGNGISFSAWAGQC